MTRTRAPAVAISPRRIVGAHHQPERIAVCIFNQHEELSRAVAGEIAALVRQHAAEGRRCVLGLATGSTPTGVYNELIRLHRQEGLSFAHVTTFNLDEYYPMVPQDLQSYRRFMREWLYEHIDIDPANAHVPDGTVSLEDVPAHCQRYERMIQEAGGIDLQLLGIGRTGHIGFNEPGSPRDSRTRLVYLDRLTRLDAASDFFGLENVPRRALTMGVATILEARRILLMAQGEGKAAIVARAVEGPVGPAVAASYLQEHPNVLMLLDPAAAAELTRVRSPWLLGPVAWDETLIRQAVIWLALRCKKPILKLTDEDYSQGGMQELLAQHGSAYEVNLRVFRALQETITGWPGGKPVPLRRDADRRRSTDKVFPKRVLVFSPHPDDDVISMGGTLLRLAQQGHDVHVAYQTSGNIAVFDHDALRFADFSVGFNGIFDIDRQYTGRLEQHIEEFLRRKKPGQVDSAEVQKIKTLIRRGEARAAGRACGVPVDKLHFLDLPFYETGQVRKKPLSEADITIVAELLEQVQPHQVYAAGDLSDPHGTHRVCLAAILQALVRLRGRPWMKDCEVWLYRGAWQEWEPQRIEMAVPLSPDELLRKRHAIFMHQSQKDKALFPGVDEREFWQRAEDRNRSTARLYDQLGLAEYEAIEAFVRWQMDDHAP